jgi:hypothetical protein
MNDVMQWSLRLIPGGTSEYREDYDVNGDDCVNLIDIMIVAAHF